MRFARFATLALLALLAARPATAQVVIPTPVREYTFSGDLNDSLGGPALQSLGGTIGATNYVFGVNQGLLLADPTLDNSNYSLELIFQFDLVSAYQRVLEFKNLGADTGLYAYSDYLFFYNIVGGPNGDIAAGVPIHMVLTRDAVTATISVYVNGQLRFNLADGGGLAVFDGPNKELYFFRDDNLVSGEAGTGSVDLIRYYNRPLTAAEVQQLYLTNPPTLVPEPPVGALLALGVTVLAARRRQSGRASG